MKRVSVYMSHEDSLRLVRAIAWLNSENIANVFDKSEFRIGDSSRQVILSNFVLHIHSYRRWNNGRNTFGMSACEIPCTW